MNINQVIEDVKKMQRAQSDAELKLSKFRGQREQEIKRLENEFNLKDVAEANKELDKLQKKLAIIDKEITEKYQILRDNYELP